MKSIITLPLLFTAGLVAAVSSSDSTSSNHAQHERRQDDDGQQDLSFDPNDPSTCPEIHLIGAGQPGSDGGFGLTESVINLFLDRFASITAAPLNYPAEGDDNYGRSVTAGLRALINQTEELSEACPDAMVVMIGYSMGAQVIDDALCGGPDEPSLITDMIPMPSELGSKILAAIWMGNPRNIGGLSYHVGDATEGGYAARPEGFTCDNYASRIQSYCSARDPYCSTGDSDRAHNNYPQMYGKAALEFVEDRANATSAANGTVQVGAGAMRDAAVQYETSDGVGSITSRPGLATLVATMLLSFALCMM